MQARLSVGLVSPGWPPAAFANGIVTYVGTLLPELRALGHEAAVVAAESEPVPGGEPVFAVADARRSRSLARRVADGLSYRVAPAAAVRAMSRRALAGAVAAMVRAKSTEVVEIEETRGMSHWVQEDAGLAVCVRLHGPWFLNGPAVGARDDAAFRDRVRDEGEAIAAADAVCAPSADVLRRVREQYRLPLAEAEVIPNPVRIPPAEERWSAAAAEPLRVLFVGRFDRHKGGDVVIDAFAAIRASEPRARLTFVGPDADCVADDGRVRRVEEYVRERVPGALEDGTVEWLGRRSPAEIGTLRRRAAVCVVASRYENFPYTVTEALAAGVPLVATRVAGIPEVVEHGESGLLVPPGDAPALASAVLTLLSSADLAAALGRRAAEHAERNLSPAAIAPRVVAAYRRAIEHRAQRR